MVTRVAVTAMPTMWVMATATRLVGDDERKGKGGKGKCNGNEGGGHQRGQGRQGNGNGNKGGGQADGDSKDEVMVTKTKEAGEEEGNGKAGKSNGDGEEDGDGKQ
jgi:hypothetical protein